MTIGASRLGTNLAIKLLLWEFRGSINIQKPKFKPLNQSKASK